MSDEVISAEFPFESRFVEVHGSRMHYVEQGEGDPILFLHGNPTSSYLWRNIIPHLSGLGRTIAVDLIGMGRSDKPDLEYRFVDHARYVEGFIEAMGLKNITLVIHDWGSALGFHYATRHQENVKGIAFMEAILMPVPSWDAFPNKQMVDLFKNFRASGVGWEMIVDQNFFIEQTLPGAIVRTLTDEEMNAYRAPYLDPPTRKPLWRWPNEIPIEGEPADVVEVVMAYLGVLQKWDVPKLHLHATPGALNAGPVVGMVKQMLPNVESVAVGQGIHYLQEDEPHRIGREIASWYQRL